MQINLVVITREYPIEVAGTKRVQHLLEHLNQIGVKIKVLSLRSRNKIEKEVGFYNEISYQRIGSNVSFSLLQALKVVSFYFGTLIAIGKAKKKGKKNIIYSYGGLNIENFLFILFAKLFGYKLIFDIVEDYSGFADKLKFISKFKFWSVRKLDRLNVYLSDAIIVISTQLQRKYEKKKAKNIILIPITAKPISDINPRIKFNEPFRVVYAGSFNDKDGVDFIIEGFIEFNQIVPLSKLYLVGSSDQQKKYVEKYQENRNIIFTGFIPDEEYFPLIQNADVLCMCRKGTAFANAGFPFKLGEYLASGNPVIATKVGDIELFLTNEDAYLIDPENKQQFVNAIQLVFKNPKEAFRKGMNGLKICKTHFSPEINGNLLAKLLLKL